MPRSRIPARLSCPSRPNAPSGTARFLRAVMGTALLAVLVACGGGGGGGGGFAGPSVGGGSAGGGAGASGLQIGSGTGTNFKPGEISASNTTLDAGVTANLRVNVVNSTNTVVENVTVQFSSTCAGEGLATFGAVTTPGPNLFAVNYTNNGCSGEDTVTASLLRDNVGVGTAVVKLTMVGPQVLTVSFVEATTVQLSLAGIGGNETSELTFKVAGPQGVPVVGSRVNFSINTNVGGASILAGRESAVTDRDGIARTVLKSGTVAGPVNVLAVEAATGLQGLSEDIIISTGVPVAGKFQLFLSEFNPPRAWNLNNIEVQVSIIASDAFGNNPTDGTRVSFVSPESGNIGSSCLLDNGLCSVVWRSGGVRPNDYRITLLAYTDGAEAFVDNNGNSVFDAADGAISDLGEPYADENENGAYNVGEFFFDTNKNGVRDSGNGLWDGPCLDKVSASAVCTGNKTVTIYDSAVIVMSNDTARISSFGTFPSTGTAISLQQGTNITRGGLFLADSNLVAIGGNPLPVGTQVAFSVEGSGATLQGIAGDTILNSRSPTGPYGTTIVAAPVDPANPLPVNVRLVLNVTVPGRTVQQFSWPLTITR